MSALRVVRPELIRAKTPEEALRLNNRLRGVLRQTVAQLMKTEPPKGPEDAPRYHAAISDTWAAGFVEAFDTYFEEWVRSEAFASYFKALVREEMRLAANG